MNIKPWIEAARLRTLPLSVSGIVLGSAYAYYTHYWNTSIAVWAILTTLGLQILSNFANDYGDGIKGTDNAQRVGPKRAIQSGTITVQAMKKALYITAGITLGLALALIYTAFGKDNFGYSVVFLALGIAAIVAAIKYTVGQSAYGYRGLGDLFVFIFFGWVSTLGSYFLYAKQWDNWLVLPATAIGLLSVAVLNLNNMRDIENDRASHKNTLVVKMGFEKAKTYHFILITVALLLIYAFAFHTNIRNIFPLLLSFIAVKHLKKVRETVEPQSLDPELKKIAMFTFLESVVLSIGLILN